MGKTYSDLSRRALIKLAEDFDNDNGGQLLDYLTKSGDKYESIRPIEVVVSRLDSVQEGLSLKANKRLEKIIDRFSDTIDTTLSSIVNSIGGDA